MFRSLLRLGPKFIKTKNYVFEDKASVKKDYFKTAVVFLGGGTFFIILAENFIMPCPDIQHDIKCVLQPEFYEYSYANGTLLPEPDIRMQARRFELERGRVIETASNADYRATFIELD